MNNSTLSLYEKQFVDIGFERISLFKSLRKQYGCTEVLYPGSSVHITPSLIFPHVVYVDQSPIVEEFFVDLDRIREYVDRNKHYKRRAYIRFIPQDFTLPLKLPSTNFDLLISLYAGGVSRACRQYLKRGGILLTNNHQDDITDVLKDEQFRLISVIKIRGGKPRYYDDNPAEFITSARKEGMYTDYLRPTNGKMSYRLDVDNYFIFERCKRGGKKKSGSIYGKRRSAQERISAR